MYQKFILTNLILYVTVCQKPNHHASHFLIILICLERIFPHSEHLPKCISCDGSHVMTVVCQCSLTQMFIHGVSFLRKVYTCIRTVILDQDWSDQMEKFTSGKNNTGFLMVFFKDIKLLLRQYHTFITHARARTHIYILITLKSLINQPVHHLDLPV
jgi:hypothetical protein